MCELLHDTPQRNPNTGSTWACSAGGPGVVWVWLERGMGVVWMWFVGSPDGGLGGVGSGLGVVLVWSGYGLEMVW